MKNRLIRSLSASTLAVLLAVVSASSPAHGQQSAKGEPSAELIATGKGARAIEGSWSVFVTFTNCQTGAPIRSFPSMATYMQGGTMQEFGIGSAPLPRGPGHGSWEYDGERAFTSAFQFFRFNADGTYAGYSVARGQIEMNGEATSFTSTSAVQIYNPVGVLVGNGCATGIATRFE